MKASKLMTLIFLSGVVACGDKVGEVPADDQFLAAEGELIPDFENDPSQQEPDDGLPPADPDPRWEDASEDPEGDDAGSACVNYQESYDKIVRADSSRDFSYGCGNGERRHLRSLVVEVTGNMRCRTRDSSNTSLTVRCRNNDQKRRKMIVKLRGRCCSSGSAPRLRVVNVRPPQ